MLFLSSYYDIFYLALPKGNLGINLQNVSLQVSPFVLFFLILLFYIDQLVLRGELKGHKNWVTCIATTDTDPNKIVTGSRGK